MITGTVKFYNDQKGFGFIQPEDGSRDVFVHATALERAGMRGLVEAAADVLVLPRFPARRGSCAGRPCIRPIAALNTDHRHLAGQSGRYALARQAHVQTLYPNIDEPEREVVLSHPFAHVH